jgi:phenylacetate-CoA ligase
MNNETKLRPLSERVADSINPLNGGGFRTDVQTWDRQTLERFQLERLNRLLEQVLRENAFYRARYQCHSMQLSSLDGLKQLPLMTKSDMISDADSGIALHHSYPPDAYRRYHRTSGTRGRPMVILDTDEDWAWWVSTWQYVLDACEITASDRVLMAFSFGPFIGFWSAHDACLHRRCMVIPSGGMSTAARIDLIHASQPTVIFSTPSYAIHLGQEAEKRGKSLRHSSVRCVFVAGEPGGSVPSVRSAIEALFGASVMDHAGATEIGPWGFSSASGDGLHVIESEFVAEYVPIQQGSTMQVSEHSLSPSGEKQLLELVLTSLGRTGAPVIRYRTGDIVCPDFREVSGESNFVRLRGGVVGRVDDMLVVRGVNVFPSSIESIVREFPEVGEYRLIVQKSGALDELKLEVEDRQHSPDRIAEKLLLMLQLRIEVVDVPEGTLPRSEGKSRRVLDRR